MKLTMRLVLICLAILIAVAAIVLFPDLWLRRQVGRLEAARNPDEVLELARPLLQNPNARTQQVLDNYAGASPLRLYDRTQNLLVLYDPHTGKLHTRGPIVGVVFSPKEDLNVEELRVVESAHEAVSFVAIPKGGGDMTLFINRGLEGFIELGVTSEELAQWQKMGIYRQFADRMGPPP
jgi:hypothetical protein